MTRPFEKAYLVAVLAFALLIPAWVLGYRHAVNGSRAADSLPSHGSQASVGGSQGSTTTRIAEEKNATPAPVAAGGGVEFTNSAAYVATLSVTWEEPSAGVRKNATTAALTAGRSEKVPLPATARNVRAMVTMDGFSKKEIFSKTYTAVPRVQITARGTVFNPTCDEKPAP